MKERVNSLVNDVKLYSKGLATSLEKNHHSEAFGYVQDMKKCLKTVEEYLEMKKEI